MSKLKAPFPWFGGKSTVADGVWQRFGDVPNYVEPFFGSGAMLLGRPSPPHIETVNDKDGFVANFWRAITKDPEAVAHHADWPVNENDLHARHAWLVGQKVTMQARLEGDPEWCDPKIAGWWCWGICCWIGGGFCSGVGPWHVQDRQLLHLGNSGKGINRQLLHLGNSGKGINRQLLHLGDSGKGINRQLLHLGDSGKGINRQLLHLGAAGQGINRKLLRLGDAGQGVTRNFHGINRKRPNIGGEYAPAIGANNQTGSALLEWFGELANRLRRVRVCCGDWARVTGPSVTDKNGMTAIFLDPPYSFEAERDTRLYNEESGTVAHVVREWAIANGRNPLKRIALCGYESEHAMPADWECFAWKASGGYGSRTEKGLANSRKERIWFSPHCLKPELDLFAA